MAMSRDEMVAAIRAELAKVSPVPEDADEVMRRFGEYAGRATMNGQNGSRNGQKPGFEWNWSIATLLTGLTFASLVMGGAIVFNQRVSTLEQKEIEASSRAIRYIPRIEALEAENRGQDAQNKVQDERIQNLSIGLNEVRRANIEIMTKLGTIGEDLAAIRVKLQVDRPSLQPGERR